MQLRVIHRRREAGQGLAEYALILSLVAVVALVALTTIGLSTRSVFERVNCGLKSGGTQQEGCDFSTPDECDFHSVELVCASGNVLMGAYSSKCNGSTTLVNLNVGSSNHSLAYYGTMTYKGTPNTHLFMNYTPTISGVCSGVTPLVSTHPVTLVINTTHSGSSNGYSKELNAGVSN